MNYELNERQRKFAEHFASHGKQADAYRFAYDADNVSAVVANERGRRQLRNQAVRDLIEALRGSPLPPVASVRDPRVYQSPRRARPNANHDTADAIRSLAAVAVSPAIPHGLRISAIDLLHEKLASVRAKLTARPPEDARGGPWGLSDDANGASMVGNGAGRDYPAGADGRH